MGDRQERRDELRRPNGGSRALIQGNIGKAPYVNDKGTFASFNLATGFGRKNTLPGGGGVIARVFPSITNATPRDPLAFYDSPPLFIPEIDEVHVSVTFTWDMPRAERLAEEWRYVGVPVKLGGPATGDSRGEFVPGRYLRDGYIITSRGCPNRCWFCSVPDREGYKITELPLTIGTDVLDANLLACTEERIRQVFRHLKDCKVKTGGEIKFTGGLEAGAMEPWIAEELRLLKPKSIFLACDSPDDLPDVEEAANMLFAAGFTRTSHTIRCYCLIGHPTDTIVRADSRLRELVRIGVTPMSMLYRDYQGNLPSAEWVNFNKKWARPWYYNKLEA